MIRRIKGVKRRNQFLALAAIGDFDELEEGLEEEHSAELNNEDEASDLDKWIETQANFYNNLERGN